MGDSEEYPLLSSPSLMVMVLRQAELGPASLEECLARLTANLAQIGETLTVGRAAALQRLSRAAEAMRRAGLLQVEAPQSYRLTARGARVLEEHPHGVDESVLEAFPEYRRWLARRYGHARPVPEPAFDEGRGGFLLGRTLADNPYPFDSASHLAWENGWFDAFDEETRDLTGTSV